LGGRGGAIPQVLLGFEAGDFQRRLRLVRPILPSDVDRLEVHGLHLSDREVSLRVGRRANGGVAAEGLGPSEVEVMVEAGEAGSGEDGGR